MPSEQGVSQFKPCEGADTMQTSEEVAERFFLTGGDASELFDKFEEALNEIIPRAFRADS